MTTRPKRKAKKSAHKRIADDVLNIPLKYGNDPMLWACWLYYEEGKIQNEIAETMGISRATVNTYLAEARTRGLVNIAIDDQKLRSLTVARALKSYFGLNDCLVVPSKNESPSLIKNLGQAGATVLEHYVKPGDMLGIGWGRTLLAVAEAFMSKQIQDVQVVQTVGMMTSRFSCAPEVCATKLAGALNAINVPLSTPAIVSSSEVQRTLSTEPLVREQMQALENLNRIIFGISSMRKNSTLHNSGFFDDAEMERQYTHRAVGAVLGRFIDADGKAVDGPLSGRIMGMNLSQLKQVDQRIAVAGGLDKIPAIIAAVRAGYVNVLVTDVSTGVGMLNAEGQQSLLKSSQTTASHEVTGGGQRVATKKLINAPSDAVDEALESIVKEHAYYLEPIEGSLRALKTVKPAPKNKVGLVIGGGAGHDPGFWGYVGAGMADAVAIGNIFASPPPGPILSCTRAAHNDAGVLYVFGNYSGDIMNSEMAAEQAKAEGIDVRTVITTDDVASLGFEDKEGRRGVAGNVFVFKIAGAACEMMYPLEKCEALAQKANDNIHTVGIALAPCSLPGSKTYSFLLGDEEMEVGVGVHGEPGVTREKLGSADDAADKMVDMILEEMKAKSGDKVALLINSLGGTPMMELHIIGRRVRQRLNARGVKIHSSRSGSYFTSLDMVGVSISVMRLDDELEALLDYPCDTPFFKV